MSKVSYVCRDCGERFAADIMDRDEAEEKRVRLVPVRCPRCGSTSVQRD